MGYPTNPPPAGYQWELQRGVNVFTGPSDVNGLNLPPYYDTGGTYHSNFGGQTSFSHGGNYSLAGAADYQLDRWIFAQWQMYVDGDATEIMAAEPTAYGASQCANVILAGTTPSSPPALWGVHFYYTMQSHSHPGDSGSLAAELLKVVGDVWAAVPGTDKYETLLGGPGEPAEEPGGPGGTGEPINPCPPPCGQNPPLPGGGGVLPSQSAHEGVSVRWPRPREAALAALVLPLACVGELTWGAEWTGARRFVLDGWDLHLRALPAGGYDLEAVYRWGKLPGTDAVGNPRYFTLDSTALDDPAYPLR